MPTRETAPIGVPCWTDLFTSDVAGSRRFYGELFGWEALAPSPEFGGYFMFARDGVPVAGAMGGRPDVPATNTWSVYLATDDLAKTVETAAAEGAEITVAPMAVADVGSQAILVDPTGARFGAWQAGTFPGFTVLDEPGTPSWFELFTRDHPRAVAFYRSVFGWDTVVNGDTDEFRYTSVHDQASDQDVAGVMDARLFLPEGVGSYWSVYWRVADVDATVAAVNRLGGAVIDEAVDTPYGRLATVADPAGAPFKLRTLNG
jgi:uncharacterized protein